jgi:hypothetical protein
MKLSTAIRANRNYSQIDRSKGIGIYFITQNPMDIPSTCTIGSKNPTRIESFYRHDRKD